MGIYLIGVVITYFVARYLYKKFSCDHSKCDKKQCDKGYGWGDVVWTIFLGLLSWLGLFFIFIGLIWALIVNSNDGEPPKWL